MLRAKTEKGLLLDTETSENWNYIRHLCYTFALCFFKEIRQIYLNDPEVKISSNRFNDLWSPLLAIARFIFLNYSQDRFKAIKDFALKQIGQAQEDGLDDRTSALLMALRDLTKDIDISVSSSQDIKKAIATYLEDEEAATINTKWIGWKLKNFGLNKDKQRISKGYLYHFAKKDIEDVLERYLDPAMCISPGKTTQTTSTTLV